MKSEYPKIDALKKKYKANKPLSLREVCFILWAELGSCSAQYLMFAHWINENKLSGQKIKWPLWKGLFDTFCENHWETMSNDFDLSLKVQRIATNIQHDKFPKWLK